MCPELRAVHTSDQFATCKGARSLMFQQQIFNDHVRGTSPTLPHELVEGFRGCCARATQPPVVSSLNSKYNVCQVAKSTNQILLQTTHTATSRPPVFQPVHLHTHFL